MESLDDRGFLVNLIHTLDLLRRRSPVGEIVDELRSEAASGVASFMEAQTAELRTVLSWADTFQIQTRGIANQQLSELLVHIKRSFAPEVPADGPSGSLQTDPITRAFDAIDGAVLVAIEDGADLAALLENFREEHHRWGFVQRSFELRYRSEASFALARLHAAAKRINPATRAESQPGIYPRVLGLGGRLDAFLFHGDDPLDTSILSAWIAQTRNDLRAVTVEIGRRIGSTRSRLSVIRRFGTWASWYARDDLRQLAGEQPGRVEAVLTERLARFLFDHGHTPLARPLLGRLEPDLLDPHELSPMYIEVKQYGVVSRARATLRQGVRQVVDTAATLIGTSLELEEAFLVVFSLAGPRLDVPTSIRVSGLTIHIVVVDLVDWKRSGSQRRDQPLRVSAEALIDGSDDRL